jgi:phosphoribosyl-ATP pyrophosphohydrolase
MTSNDSLDQLARVLESRKGGDPDSSYTARLLHKGPDAFLKKMWFHSMVALAHYGLSPQDVIAELDKRVGTSGLEEKASRKAKDREVNESTGVKP